MGEKKDQKKSHIVEAAQRVFAEKGFRNVTMQDIVAASGTSRGGLYLHFNTVEEVFLAVLLLEAEAEGGESTDSLPIKASSADILALFMKEQKKEILRKAGSLAIAIYEYYFHLYQTEGKIPKKDNFLKKQFETGVMILENLIRDGLASGEFYCDDPSGAAANIMYTLEGLKVAARTIGITEAVVDKELLYILQGLVVE
ncbi:MAG: TetR/AcrR family transcriptional regulator [Lachnospiraceae bacterium]|jgi:AcrR family transcriptional regulator|nr:TetR/AcrR family transcriptional regulator [Lachnospiraceae bacterium]